MKALRLYAGPVAREHIARNGLRPHDVRTIPGAAGGPKGLILGPLDRFIFGPWLAQSEQPIDLVGASIGAWRLASACMASPVEALAAFEGSYIAQHFEPPPGQKRITAAQLSEQFGDSLRLFFKGQVAQVLHHPRLRLHIVAAHGRHLLAREGRVRIPLGCLGALASNAVHRKGLDVWLERVVFSSPGAALPFATDDFRTRTVALTETNFAPALQASCSIPFMLRAVTDIPGAPRGAYWDGGLTDYHLHLHYNNPSGVVLYPHFQKSVVPGWLDKPWRRRHRATPFLERMVVLAPDAQWLRSLPNGKLPDRADFVRHGNDWQTRAALWTTAAQAARQLAEEFEEWLVECRPEAVQEL